jgi:hypothetical protein
MFEAKCVDEAQETISENDQRRRKHAITCGKRKITHEERKKESMVERKNVS